MRNRLLLVLLPSSCGLHYVELVTDAQKEKIKLRAAYVNGMANAFVVAGALTVPLAVATNSLPPAFAAPFSFVCFGVSFRLHIIAQGVLDGLDQ